MRPIRIIPVIDLKGGIVVHGVGGRRDQYQPIRSKLTSSCQPVDVARAFRDRYGFRELYLADLDAIADAEPAWDVYAAVQRLDFRLWVDAGVRDRARAVALRASGIDNVVLGLETVPGPVMLEKILESLRPKRAVFSLDLRDGEPMGACEAWNSQDALGIVDQVIGLGVHQMIVLDVARVGRGQGLGTQELCRQIKDRHPQVELIAGGGVRGEDDLIELAKCGVSAALVASALHDGVISGWKRLR